MIWTYRVFRDRQGRYSIREVFCEGDSTIINYDKTPVSLMGASLEELMQLVQWFKEAFDLPVLSLESIDEQLAIHEAQPSPDYRDGLSIDQVMAELAADSETLNHNQS
ncbi:MAG: hypothetical protein MH825_15620 [Cyanobacteria bacterium]|nr:hypothetical protein [Cyanobacteriota bacterium]